MYDTLAESYAHKYHQGQYRKGTKTPYFVHPENVVKLLIELGYDDDVTISVGWLHDTIEDTALGYKDIFDVFGRKVADGVRYLTRDVGNEEYKKRLSGAPLNIQIVKLADTYDNTRMLEKLSPQGIERKIEDCLGYYIPLAKEICPEMAIRLKENINWYLCEIENN